MLLLILRTEPCSNNALKSVPGDFEAQNRSEARGALCFPAPMRDESALASARRILKGACVVAAMEMIGLGKEADVVPRGQLGTTSYVRKRGGGKKCREQTPGEF